MPPAADGAALIRDHLYGIMSVMKVDVFDLYLAVTMRDNGLATLGKAHR